MLGELEEKAEACSCFSSGLQLDALRVALFRSESLPLGVEM